MGVCWVHGHWVTDHTSVLVPNCQAILWHSGIGYTFGHSQVVFVMNIHSSELRNIP